MTLTCRRCQLTVLVLEPGVATAAPKCCGVSMEPATPPRCSSNPSSIGSAYIELGAIYLDAVTGQRTFDNGPNPQAGPADFRFDPGPPGRRRRAGLVGDIEDVGPGGSGVGCRTGWWRAKSAGNGRRIRQDAGAVRPAHR